MSFSLEDTVVSEAAIRELIEKAPATKKEMVEYQADHMLYSYGNLVERVVDAQCAFFDKY